MRIGKLIRVSCWSTATFGLVACSSAPTGAIPLSSADGSASISDDTGAATQAVPDEGASTASPTQDSACSAKGTRKECQTCCGTVHAEAGIKFFAGALMCACAMPSLCAAIQGEAGAGDASSQGAGTDAGAGGALGQGACTDAMCSGQTVPSDGCRQCVTMTLQPASGFGACTLSAAASCGQDAVCMPVLDCATKCAQPQ
ncbi:MAG: hypothetical protein M3O50_09305 [Myxococcota bacterium]|nr:hypothetical protein [Myxococcota bacterium]